MIISSLRKSKGSDGTFAITGTAWIEIDVQFVASSTTLCPKKLCKRRTLQEI